MYSRSAGFFKRLAAASTESLILHRMAKVDAVHAAALAQQTVELDRIYKQIEASAKDGGIRVFLSKEDPVWRNSVVLTELRKNGFSVSQNYHSSQGAIEWKN